jgi:hypothetical protein
MDKKSAEGQTIKEIVAQNYHENAKVDGNTITWIDENNNE